MLLTVTAILLFLDTYTCGPMRAEASQQGHVEVIFGEGEEWNWREIQRGCFHSVLVPLQKITEAHMKMIIRIQVAGTCIFIHSLKLYLFIFLKIF